jgi:purine-binding chemotaxis protein CheW
MKDGIALKINSYLTFKLGEEVFGANVSKVLNILEMTKITKVPKAPVYMKGVINLRGSVLPLIDTRIKFDMSETEYTTNTCILVLDIDMNGDSVHVGALVDSVQEVIEIEDSQISPPPSIGSKYRSEFIEGMAKIGDEFIMLLNMDLIFSANELSLLKESTGEVQLEEGEVKK